MAANQNYNSFNIRPPQYRLVLSTISFFFCLIKGITLVIWFENFADILGLIIYGFLSIIFLFLVINLLSWKITVSGNQIKCHSLLYPTKKINFNDIDVGILENHFDKNAKRRRTDSGLVGTIIFYSKNKELFKVDSMCRGYKTFIVRLKQENIRIFNKIDEQNFTLRTPESWTVFIIFALVLTFITIWIASEISTDYNDYIWIVYLFLAVLLIIIAFDMAKKNKWKISVKGNIIQYSSLFKPMKTFHFDKIDKVKIKLKHIYRRHGGYTYKKYIIYSRRKKLFVIHQECYGYDIFISRLKKQNIRWIGK